jgi:thymidylate synthase (FAD)
MRIVKEGKFRILTPRNFVLSQIKNVEKAGRISHQSQSREPTIESSKKFIKKILELGHESVLEHTIVSVLLMDVSRGLTHEIVRHRHTAFTQESTRYVGYGKYGKVIVTKIGNPKRKKKEITFVIPPWIRKNQKIILKSGEKTNISKLLEFYANLYESLLSTGWKPEDARQFLPIGIASQTLVTTNLREWRHIFKVRTTPNAHWEIRTMMIKVLNKMKEMVPVVFDDFKEIKIDEKGIPYYE